MRCLFVEKKDDGTIVRRLAEVPQGDLPPGEVLVRVAYSSLNYKDALAATGHPGVVSNFPHVPGIDAAGTVLESSSNGFQAGDEVLVTSFELGAGRWGGFAEFIRVPSEWVVPLPAGLTLRESMALGTAGLTVALCLQAIERQGVTPQRGPVVVTGASGGVGTLAVALLSQLGYQVVAVSGKPECAELLKKLGAAEVVPREAVIDTSTKPMLKPRWAAAMDTVGGAMLASIVRAAQPLACITACGLVGGTELPLNIYPFILRGASLVGIDSANYPASERAALWQQLAGAWKPRLLEAITREVTLDNMNPAIDAILAGQMVGRTVVKIG